VKERKEERKKKEAKVDTFQNIKHLPLSPTLKVNTILIGNIFCTVSRNGRI